MLTTVGEFTRRVRTDLNGLIQDLQDHTQRRTRSEADAWRDSFPRVVSTLEKAAPGDLDMVLGGTGDMMLEYRLPAASTWADLVLLGRNQQRPAAVIIELKHWQTRADLPGVASGLIHRHGSEVLHPSDQVKGYVEYCRQFHSTIAERAAGVEGCVLFTRDEYFHSYRLAPNDELTRLHPCFFAGSPDADGAFRDYLSRHLLRPDRDFATAFVRGQYRQNRSFILSVGQQIQDAKQSPFVLLDFQRQALSIVKARVLHALKKRGTGRSVLAVVGPPGSGKSVVAARVWAELATTPALPASELVIVTTSSSQRSNWQALFERAGGPGAEGVILGATSFCPVSTQTFGRLRKRPGSDFRKEEHWRHNCRHLESLGEVARDGARDLQFGVSLCDEAHALINPEHSSGRGQFGFATAFGPQAWHIMRCSRVSVFLLDPDQGFRDRENSSLEDLRQWARDFGAQLEEISLEGSQFRCGGSLPFIHAADALLGYDPQRRHSADAGGRDIADTEPAPLAAADLPVSTYRIQNGPGRFNPFEVCLHDDPFSMEEGVRERLKQGGTARLLAGYAVPWKTKNVALPHLAPDSQKDFHLPIERDGGIRYWSRIWNYAPKEDYTLFVQAPPGSKMHEDPLCEIGCPYTVRGFDFDHVGLLWMRDLVWRGNRWVAQPDHSHESGFKRLCDSAKKERDPFGPKHAALEGALRASYRILLTRSLKSLHIWCIDPETDAHLRSMLG